MSGDGQKFPFVEGITEWTQRVAQSTTNQAPKSFPVTVVDVTANGALVTVNFEILDDIITLPQIQCPVATDKYARAPIRKGDRGYVVPSDIYLGGVSGLGGGTATLQPLPNLTTLVFHPIGNTDFPDLKDPDKYEIRAPKGGSIATDSGNRQTVVGPVNGGPNNCIQLIGMIQANSDADAQAKGIPINGLYYDSSGFVKIRLT